MHVYLDNAASTPLDPEVFEAMRPFMLSHFGNPSSTHAFGRHLKNALEEARRTIAKQLNAHPMEIFFTGGGTEADNIAIMGAVESLEIQHIISSPIEHHAVEYPIQKLEKMGTVTVTWLSVDKQGNIDRDELVAALRQHDKCLVSLMHANNEIGTIYDIEEIGQICREHGALFHSDTVQTMGKLPLDTQVLPVDFLTAAAHKFYGPKGVGFLYVRRGVDLKPIFTGGGQERDLRPGTENLASIIGMAFALEKCYRIREAKVARILELERYFRDELRRLYPGIRINGEEQEAWSLPGVLNITFPGEADSMFLFNLDLAGIAASGGSACQAGASMGSHVLRHIGAADGGTSVRFSIGVQNTREELDYVLTKLQEIIPVQVA